jgi:protein involved in polysaccharide export with SLBB domain
MGEMNLSDFERFVSGETLEITDSQFDILSRFEGIVFQYTKNKIPTGRIAIPVKVMRRDRTGNYPPELLDAGYLVGDRENIGAVFTILGIKSTYPMATELRQFGYDLFGSGPASFTPAENVPVGPEYVIGPGDEIKITVWGKIDGQWIVTVDRDGTISLPQLGTIGVAGLTFSELKEQLFREMSRNYTGFEMNVGLGSLRTMRIYLVGNARKPGAYTLSSLSTIVSALFETGGPAKSGSLRNLELRRNGKPVAVFDMYDFLIKGDKTKDARLLPEDVIFIPPIGKVAAIAGNVNNPAIYEIKDEKTITGLIGLAGGLNALAFEGRVQIERIVDNSRQTVFESDIATLKDKEVPVESGDVVKIFQIVKDKKTVKLAGAVQREGDFGFSPGMTVKDLVDLAGGLQYFAYSKEAELTRVHVTDEGPKTEKIMIDLEKALAGETESNMELKGDDYLFIRTVPEWRLYRIVKLSGEVKFPGNYTIRKGERLSSLFERAGGFTDKAYLRGAVFLRASVQEAQQTRLTESIDRLEQHMLSSSLLETQTALSAEEVARQKTLQSQQAALLAKMRSAKPLGRLTIRLEENIETFAGSTFDVELEEGDSIFIPDRPASVNVMGSLYNPTAFIYNPEASVSDYIQMAGGLTEEAEDDNIFVLKADGSAVSRQQSSFWGLGWNPETKRYESGTFMAKKLDAGDTIVVPPKLEKFSWLKETKDITQILYQIAVAAGVLIVAF